MIVSCDCGAKLRIDDAKVPDQSSVKVHCPRCGRLVRFRKEDLPPAALQPEQPEQGEAQTAPLVLIAHDSDAVRDMVGRVLQEAGFCVDWAVDGHEALRKVKESRPHCLVLDVGLPGIYGFDLCDRLKGDAETNAIGIVLLSSVYDKRKYKRKPTSLYGADDYIEKHHIADSLPAKIHRLISTGKEPSAEIPSGMEQDHVPSGSELMKEPEIAEVVPEPTPLNAAALQQAECDPQRVQESDPHAVEEARRFARIIISDIALYNQEAVHEGLAKGTLAELLRAEIEEGRQLYEARVTEAVRKMKDYYQEAVESFMKASQQKNVR